MFLSKGSTKQPFMYFPGKRCVSRISVIYSVKNYDVGTIEGVCLSMLSYQY